MGDAIRRSRASRWGRPFRVRQSAAFPAVNAVAMVGADKLTTFAGDIPGISNAGHWTTDNVTP